MRVDVVLSIAFSFVTCFSLFLHGTGQCNALVWVADTRSGRWVRDLLLGG